MLPHNIDAAIEKIEDGWNEVESAFEFTEIKEGETLLGGEMRLSAKFIKDTTSEKNH